MIKNAAQQLHLVAAASSLTCCSIIAVEVLWEVQACHLFLKESD